MYNRIDLHELNNSFANKLFLTFTNKDNLDNIIDDIKSSYTILYNKIFVFEIEESSELAVTYNVECGNIDFIPDDTILVHRNKNAKVLYTINALNILVKLLNEGKPNKNFMVPWDNYKNSILLTNNQELKEMKTRIHKIIEC